MLAEKRACRKVCLQKAVQRIITPSQERSLQPPIIEWVLTTRFVPFSLWLNWVILILLSSSIEFWHLFPSIKKAILADCDRIYGMQNKCKTAMGDYHYKIIEA